MRTEVKVIQITINMPSNYYKACSICMLVDNDHKLFCAYCKRENRRITEDLIGVFK